LQRLTTRIIVAAFTCAVGCAVTFFWRIPNPANSTARSVKHTDLLATPRLPQERTYSVEAAGKAATKNGIPASFSSISSSDGMRFSQWSEYHHSPRAASRTLEEALKRTTAIVEKKVLCDQEARQVGEQVVATFSSQHPHFGAASLLWTNGSNFRYVASPSLQNIMEYEKDLTIGRACPRDASRLQPKILG
jgi:hypothetical protein